MALGLEDWASSLADRETEIQYLHALASDLRDDSSLLASIHIPNAQRAQSLLAEIGPVARGDAAFPADTAGFLLIVARSHSTPLLMGTGPTYEELLATGSLRLLESASLRAEIVSFYQFKTLAGLRDEMRASGYADLVRSHLPEAGNDLREGFDWVQALGVLGVTRAAEGIRTREFVMAVGRHLNYWHTMGPTLDDLFVRARDLIPRIDAEIDRLD